MKLSILLPAVLVFATISVSARGEDSFAKANQSYTGGNFKEAAAGYEDLIRDGRLTAPLFYNLGNSYFRLHDYGKAILNYERALALEPGHPEAQTNLRIAREEAHALELPQSWTDRVTASARPSDLAIAACVLFWLGLFIVVSLIGTTGRRRGGVVIGITLLALAAGFGAIVFLAERSPHGGGVAVVTAKQTSARLATADTAANVLTLPSGSEIKIEQERGEWAYAFLPNGSHGWVPLHQIEAVQL